jgi:hypothetical protein
LAISSAILLGIFSLFFLAEASMLVGQVVQGLEQYFIHRLVSARVQGSRLRANADNQSLQFV